MKKRVLLLVLLLGLLFSVRALAVGQLQAVLSETDITIDLAVKNTYQLASTVLPAGASQKVVWNAGNKKVVTVSSKGLVKALKKGVTAVSVRPSTKPKSLVKCRVTVIDSLCPESILMGEGSHEMNVFDTQTLSASACPETASQAIVWKTSNAAVATVSSNGVVTAKKAGTVVIYACSARDTSVKASFPITVTKLPTPKKLLILPEDTTLALGETLQLGATPVPDTAGPQVKWSTSSSKIAAVTQNGLVTAKKVGTVKIKATSKYSSKVYTVRTIKVYDPTIPTSLEISAPENLVTGTTVSLTATIEPATAQDAEIVWKISDTELGTISSDGTLTLKNAGRARITATTVKGRITKTLDIVVNDPTIGVCVTTPLRQTDISGIADNIERIENIEQSAYDTISALLSTGAISASEAQDRHDVVERAFTMQKFVWMTPSKQAYWRKANSENGLKDFKPNIVYYGLPYIQRSSTTTANRTFGVEKAISQKRYTDSGKGYYLLNQSNLLGGSYCGSDCSSFVSQCQRVSTAHLYDLCAAIAKNSAYKVVTNGFDSLRPGDMIIRSKYDAHVVLFLYYTNASKTRMMIIEQGGGSAGDSHNTISCSIVNVQKYKTENYTVMRKKSYK